MGYYLQVNEVIPKYIQREDENIAVDETEASTTQNVYTAIKSFEIKRFLDPTSTFYLYYEAKRVGATNSYTRWFHNDVAIGTEKTIASDVYDAGEEAITTETWNKDDTLVLKAKAGAGSEVFVQRARIQGVTSVFI